MFTISVETRFWASHRLKLPDGSREPSHSHNWAVAADVSTEGLDSMGLAIDFRRLKGLLDEIAAEFENGRLENLDYFQQNNPSAENVAKYVCEQLERKLPNGLKLNFVKVTEQPGCAAKFAP